MIGKRYCSAVSALIDFTEAKNSLLMLRVLSVDVSSTWENLRINSRDFSRAFSTIMMSLLFSHVLTYWCVYIGLSECTLGLSWLGLWKVPG